MIGISRGRHRVILRYALLLASLVTLAILVLSGFGVFDGFGRLVNDRRLRARDFAAAGRGQALSRRITIVDVPPADRAAWRAAEPGSRQELAGVVRRLAALGARAIVLNIALDVPGDGDEELAAACRDTGIVVLKAQLESPRPTQYGLTRPVRVIRQAAFGYGYSYWVTDPDGIARHFSIALNEVSELSLSTITWALVTGQDPEEVRTTLRSDQMLPGGPVLPADLMVYFDFRGPPRLGFPIVPLAQLDATQPLAGRVIVIGPLDPSLGGLNVPLSENWRPESRDRWPEPMTPTELLANAIETLLNGRAPRDLPLAWLAPVLLFGGFWIASLIGSGSLGRGSLLTLLLIAGWGALSGWLYREHLLILPLAEGWVMFGACFGLGLYQRLHRDVLHHREQAEAAENERTRLAELDDAKRAVLGTVVHDLKVPVAIIKGQALTLASDPERQLGAEIHAEFLDTIASQCDRLASMIEDILDTDPARRLSLHLEPTDLAELIRTVLEMHEATASRHRFRLETEPLAMVPLDRTKVTRVLNNLISNAVKYSPDGGEVLVRVYRQQPNVVVEVRDHGIGMTAEQMERLFGLFVRVLDQPDSIPGTGVGLYSAKRLVEAQGGDLTVDSLPDEGSTFRFTLPLAGPPAE